MKVLVDKYIPFLSGILEPYAEVGYLGEDEFTHERIKDADALIIRTTVHCDRILLEGTSVRFIATATIGFDHIDTSYCISHGVHVCSCPGCNAEAVCDYVEEAVREYLISLSGLRSLSKLSKNFTLGVVGVGHVGALVARMAEKKGFRVLLNDPPKRIGVSLRELAEQSDIITFHTPLNREGAYPTYHLCDEALLRCCCPHALIINAARGGVVDEKALLQSGHPYVIDCWEGEPAIDNQVLLSEQALLTSYHIAGYSVEGKKRASAMCITAFGDFFGIESLKNGEKVVSLHPDTKNMLHGDNAQGWLRRVSDSLKAHPEAFTQLRKQYKLR